MKDKPLISIIVPVYNVKEYLENCLKSIGNQTYERLEIIIIEDGSTDGSEDICDEFVQTDSRSKVIHQKNAGVAAARRNGVLCANGEYICFVDADDEIDCNMMEYLEGEIGEYDMITSGCYYEGERKEYIELTDAMGEGCYSTEKEMKYLIANMLAFENRFEYGILPYLVVKMFKADLLKEVIKNINPVLSYAEDVELLFQYILQCKAIRITHACFYYYHFRKESASNTVNRNYMYDLNKVYLSLEKVFKGHLWENVLMHQLQLFVAERIYSITGWMGFPADAQMIRYVFPFPELEQSCRIVLYGAGNVGMDYYRLIFRRNLVHLVLWVDKGWKTYQNDYTPVLSPKEIWNYEYDYIIIAIKKEKIAKEIQQELVQMGIAEEKILWRVPAVV